ncbi:MAG: hypothetical protein Q7R90_04985 [bacterium]|nr:hypothetical protein [bacterium]
MISLARTLKSSAAAVNPGFVPSCTFSPRGRNRYACNTCTKANGGGPIVLKRNQLEGHRTGVFLRNNPRSKLPPITPYEPQKTLAARSGSQKGLMIKYISMHSERWICHDCFEENRFEKNWGIYGSAGVDTCRGCNARFLIERGGA